MSKFTKGPWHLENGADIFGEDCVIAEVYDNPGEDEAMHNIDLIIAAPDLYEACKKAKWAFGILLEGGGVNLREFIDEMDKVILKVDGD